MKTFPNRDQFKREIISVVVLGFMIAVLFVMAYFLRNEP